MSEVLQVLEDIKANRQAPLAGGNKKILASGGIYSSTPPLSPKKGVSTPFSPSKSSFNGYGNLRVGSPYVSSPTVTVVGHPETFATLPPLYYPAAIDQQRRRVRAATLEFLAPYGDQIPLMGLKALFRNVFKLPTCLAYPLLSKIAPTSDNLLSTASLQSWLLGVDFAGCDPVQRTFHVLRGYDRQTIGPQDLKPLMYGILACHPGLSFLEDSPEFQGRYAETVIHRIFYALNSSGSGALSLRDIRRGDLLGALQELEAEEDINRCVQYFSYEHFYVIYCKFWDLDMDHDFLLSRDDLLRYGNHSLTYRIADRIFEGAARPLSCRVAGRMSYEDFVWFILSEEDKGTNTALEYWFRACDLNGDDRLTPDELLYFYEEQLGRMECLSQETVGFEDVLTQMQDMLNPKTPEYFTLRDLKQSRQLAGTLFNVLFNLNKFVAFETRDPFTVRQEREDAASGMTDWERFAKSEYQRLAVEDEGLDGGEDTVWGQSMAAHM